MLDFAHCDAISVGRVEESVYHIPDYKAHQFFVIAEGVPLRWVGVEKGLGGWGEWAHTAKGQYWYVQLVGNVPLCSGGCSNIPAKDEVESVAICDALEYVLVYRFVWRGAANFNAHAYRELCYGPANQGALGFQVAGGTNE